MSLPNQDLEFIPYDPLSAGQLNDIVENVESLADGTGFNDDAVPAQAVNFGGYGTGIWWEEIGRTTLTVAGDTISVTGLPSRKYLHLQVEVIGSGLTDLRLRFNNDTGNNYAYRYIFNGASGSAINANGIDLDGAGGGFFLGTYDVINVDTQRKMVSGVSSEDVSAGAGTAPTHLIIQGKWANTADLISRIDIVNVQTGDFAIGSQLVVLGHD